MRSIRKFLAMMTAVVALTAAPVIAATRSNQAVPSDREIAAFMDTIVASKVKEHGIPGAALVVARDGRPILSKGYGVADLSTKQSIDVDQSLLRQGSISKMFGWILAMQLVEQGRLDLDRDVNQFLDFRVPEAFGAPITFRHLLTHSAGFADRTPLIKRGTRGQPLGTRLKDNMPERAYAPGSTVAYSNYGAALAGYIVERLGGKPFERLVEERIFAPAGMSRSTFDQPVPARLAPALVSNYSASAWQPSKFEYVGFAPAGSLTASGADMGRFVAMLTNGGAGAHGMLLRPATIDRMMRVQRPLVRGLTSGLGLGFIVGEYRGVRYAGHGGSMNAAATDLEILPDHGLGWTISFTGRGINGAAIPLRAQLLRAVIDRFYRLPAPPIDAAEVSTADEVAGSYIPTRRIHSGVLTLMNLNTLEAKIAPGGGLTIDLEGALTTWRPAGRDRFVEENSGLPLAVERGADGRINRLASPLINGVTAYEPASLALRLGYPVTLLAPPTLLLAGLVGAVAWVIGRTGRKARARRAADAAPAPRPRRMARGALGFIVLTLLGWIVYLGIAVTQPDRIDAMGSMLMVLNVLSIAVAVAATVILVDAVLAWRDPARGRWSRLSAALVAPAAISFAWLLFAFDFARLGPAA